MQEDRGIARPWPIAPTSDPGPGFKLDSQNDDLGQALELTVSLIIWELLPACLCSVGGTQQLS